MTGRVFDIETWLPLELQQVVCHESQAKIHAVTQNGEILLASYIRAIGGVMGASTLPNMPQRSVLSEREG